MFWESAVEENNKIIMDTSYHMQCNSPSAGLGRLGSLNISAAAQSTLQEISDEHMSFYGDDEAQALALQQQAQDDDNLWNTEQLLLPEGPAQRFRIVKKPKSKQQQQHNQLQYQQQQRLQDATNSQNKTPSRGFRVFNSLSSSCSMESTMDDDYMELLEMESLEEQLQQDSKANFSFPSNLNSLISGQIKSSLTPCTPEMRRPSARRCLSLCDSAKSNEYQETPTKMSFERQQLQSKFIKDLTTDAAAAACTTPYSSRLVIGECHENSISPFNAFCFKRPDPPSVTNSPIQPKRYRGEEKENLKENLKESFSSLPPKKSISTGRVPYRKSMSMNDAEIMSALARSDSTEEPDLIGDFSKPFALPLIDGRHRDLKTISSDTVARLIKGEFDPQVAKFIIIDCRYPYEYDGGHIRGAKNLYAEEHIIEEFLTQQKTEQLQACPIDAAGNKRNIIIFHCEFSSERGPRLSRFLRNNDRARNTHLYPTLDYPEIYLLHNGYKEFYETHSELCDPQSYRPMLEPAYSDEYRHFRAKSKSWNGGGLGGATSRHKKSRSRLML